VTPKGRIAANRGRIDAPLLLRAALGASFIGAAVYVLHLLGAFTIPYESEWAAAGAFGWLVLNAALVWTAIRRVESLRFAAERRSAVRFAVDLPGAVDGAPVSVQDVSVGGALVATLEPVIEREAHLLSFELPTGMTSLWSQVRSSRRADSGEHHYAFEFEPGQYQPKGALARAVFAGRYPVAATVRTPWADLLPREIGSLSHRFRTSGGATIPAAPIRRATTSAG
jgi:hypothetical protein